MEHHRPVFHSAVIFIAVGPLVGNICAWTYLVLTDPSGGGSDLAEFFTPLMFLLAMGSLAVAYIGGKTLQAFANVVSAAVLGREFKYSEGIGHASKIIARINGLLHQSAEA